MQSADIPESRIAAQPGQSRHWPPALANEGTGSQSCRSRTPGSACVGRAADVFVFNPFAEAYIAHGKAYTPVKSQAMLAEDLANLPQFLCQPGDVVLLTKRPTAGFLNYLQQAGFELPEFVELKAGSIDAAGRLCSRKCGSFRPWAWGPDAVKLFQPLFARRGDETAKSFFNDGIAQLYSKAWSADFLGKVLAQSQRAREMEHCLCDQQDVGVEVDTLEGALAAIAAIRSRGHHRVVIKAVFGLAGQNAIRLWEPEILPVQRQWLVHALESGQKLVVEPWLDRALDFSVQLQRTVRGLELIGYTGLINDRKGQFLANWAEADYHRCLPVKVAILFSGRADISERLLRLYVEIFSLLEAELEHVGFLGPIGIDALVYRTPQGNCRLKPVVEINPRYTMGRLTLELMKHTCPGSCGLFRLVTLARVRKEGFPDLSSYATSLGRRFPLRLAESVPVIRQGAVCLNDPAQAQVSLATFEVSPELNLPPSLSGNQLSDSP